MLPRQVFIKILAIIAVIGIVTTGLSVALPQPPRAAAEDSTGVMPAPSFHVASRQLEATAWGPVSSGAADCGTAGESRACQILLRLEVEPGWSNYAQRMTELGVDMLRVGIADECPRDANPAFTTKVISATTSAQIIQLGCDYSQLHSVDSVDVPLTWEWRDAATGVWAPAGWPRPMPEPLTWGYDGDAPVVESHPREWSPTAWGPAINAGQTCSGAYACEVRIRLQVRPEWADWQQRIKALGYDYGRITIAAACPDGANEAFTSDAFMFASRGLLSTDITIGCDYSQYWTVEDRLTPWRFQWHNSKTGEWVDTGGQISAEGRVANAYPSLNLDEYVDALMAASAAGTACNSLLFVPDPGPNISSTPKAYVACSAAMRGPMTRAALRAALAGLAATYGYAVLDRMASDPEVVVPRDEPPRQPTRPTSPGRPVLPGSGSDSLEDTWEQTEEAPQDENARRARATACRQMVAEAGLPSVGVGGSAVPRHPCEVTPVFSPGSDVPAAASHKARAISAHPSWVELHQQSRATTDTILQGLGFESPATPWITWRSRVPANNSAYLPGSTFCAGGNDLFQCDEYPYGASVEGVPQGDPSEPQTWTGFSLDWISAADNAAEGRMLGQFKSACQVTDPGEPFLVVPVPQGPPTGWQCAPS